MDILAVINNYNYDCEWTTKLPFPFEMLSNHSLQNGEATNACFDIVNYLRYIIQNYNDLHDITWFFHGHEYGWHHFGKSILEIIKDIDYSKDYYNISQIRNDYFYGINESLDNDTRFHRKVIQKLYEKSNYFFPILNLQKNTIITKFNAEFYIKKELILKHSLKFYKDLLDVIYDFRKESVSDAGNCTFVFERLWGYIFTGRLIDDSSNKITIINHF